MQYIAQQKSVIVPKLILKKKKHKTTIDYIKELFNFFIATAYKRQNKKNRPVLRGDGVDRQ